MNQLANGQKILLFYWNLSPIGTAALLAHKKNLMENKSRAREPLTILRLWETSFS